MMIIAAPQHRHTKLGRAASPEASGATGVVSTRAASGTRSARTLARLSLRPALAINP